MLDMNSLVLTRVDTTTLMNLLLDKTQLTLFKHQHNRAVTQYFERNLAEKSLDESDWDSQDEFLESVNSKLATQLTERSASTAFNGLQDVQVDSELTRKLLLGVFEKKVSKLMSSHHSLYRQSDSEKEDIDGDSQRKIISASKGDAKVESYHSAGNVDDGEKEAVEKGKEEEDEDSEEPKSIADDDAS